MQGSLALAHGTLLVGLQAKTAHVRAFDLGGRALGPAFSFRDPAVGRSSASGLAFDDDHSILVADAPAHRVRRFTLFGREVGGLGGPPAAEGEAPMLPGRPTQPLDVEVRGNHDEGWIAIACGGEQRHGVQLFDPGFSYRASCVSLGEPGRAFLGASRLASEDEFLYVAESTARRVQVFRAGQFLFAFRLTRPDGEVYEPSALAAVGDGRLVIGCRAPRSALFLAERSGRVLRELAGPGDEEGSVREPSDAVISPGAEDRHSSLYVIDRDGLRVQVFTLEGRCLGAFPLSASLAAADRAGSKESEGGR